MMIAFYGLRLEGFPCGFLVGAFDFVPDALGEVVSEVLLLAGAGCTLEL